MNQNLLNQCCHRGSDPVRDGNGMIGQEIPYIVYMPGFFDLLDHHLKYNNFPYVALVHCRPICIGYQFV